MDIAQPAAALDALATYATARLNLSAGLAIRAAQTYQRAMADPNAEAPAPAAAELIAELEGRSNASFDQAIAILEHAQAIADELVAAITSARAEAIERPAFLNTSPGPQESDIEAGSEFDGPTPI